jgi:signal transduction histidine kinase
MQSIHCNWVCVEGNSRNLGRLREFSARRQEGSEFPVDLRISDMHVGDKRMFVGIIRDITERRAIAQMKNQFISTVSHELRTPLTSIMGSLTLLLDGAAGELFGKVVRLIGMAEKTARG